ncbi:MAG: hypothetical protein AAF688_07345 [Bacteroidota bacterium]
MQYSELQARIDSAKELDFGQIFNQSIELFKKVWLQGLLILLLTFALMIPFIIIFYTPLVILGIADSSNPGYLESAAPFAVFFMIIAYLLLLFAVMVISTGLRAALFKIIGNKDQGDELTKDDYFLYLRRPYLSKTIALGFANLGISLLATMLCFFPIIYATVPLNLMVVIYAFNPELSTSELVNAGFKLGNKKWLITFGLTLVAGFLAQMVGMLMCGIGIFFTASFVVIPLYFVYKESVGLQDDELKQIGNNLENNATI